MSRLGAVVLLIMVAGGPVSAMASSVELAVSMSPSKATYVVGEPVTVTLTLQNRTTDTIEIFFDYPWDMGVSFSRVGEDVGGSTGSVGDDRRIPVLSIAGGSSYQVMIVLNRFLAFDRVERRVVAYHAEYLEPVGPKRPRPRTFAASGEFSVSVTAGVVDAQQVSDLVGVLKGGESQARKEAVERLLWTDDAVVIPSLVTASTLYPRYGADIVRALARFRSPSARAALSRLVCACDVACVEAFLEVAQTGTVTVAEEEYRSLLTSRDVRVRLSTLQYIVRQQDRGGFVDLVKLVAQDENPTVRKIAEDFLGESG